MRVSYGQVEIRGVRCSSPHRHLKHAGWIAMAGTLLLLSGCGINTIPTYKQQVDASWSQVLNEYQRRTDLIPNLVATVKGYAAHEAERPRGGNRGSCEGHPDPDPVGHSHQPEGVPGIRAEPGYPGRRAVAPHGGDRELPQPQGRPELPHPAGPARGNARTGSPWRAATTSSRCSSTTRSSPPFRAAGTARMFYGSYRQVQNFTISEQAQQAPQVKF